MGKNIYPDGIGDLLAWLANFISVADENQAELGLTAADITELATMRGDLLGKFNDSVTKHEAAKASTVALSQSKQTIAQRISSLNKIFKGNTAVGKVLLESLGLKSNDTNLTPITAQAPSDLVVEGRSNGINYLKFNRNGNKPSVTFILEAKTGAETEYKFVTVLKKTRFQHKNQTPGVRVFYRVKTVHGEQESAYSNEAVIYN